jgi:hypothetical protein
VHKLYFEPIDIKTGIKMNTNTAHKKRSLFIGVATISAVMLLSACSERREIPQSLNIAEEYEFQDEHQTAIELGDVLEDAIAKRYGSATDNQQHNKQHKRDAHPKAHGCVRADFSVNEGLADELKVGLFSEPASYPAYIRLSTGSGKVESDKQKEFLGMGIKVMGVGGDKLIENEQQTQDFLLISTNVEAVRTSKEFLKVVEASLAGNPLNYFLNPSDLHIKEFMVAAASKKHHTSPLDIRYWSTVPYLFGERQAVKYSVKNCALATGQLPDELTDNYLREAMVDQLSNGEVCYDFMVQFQQDSYKQPIEDAFVEWDESATPFINVARITIPQQTFDTEGQNEFCENMSLNPWHARKEHRPLGNMNRARKIVYDRISKFRHSKNQLPRTEPTGNEVFK